MALAAWSPSEAALGSHHECAPSQVGTRFDMTLDVARMSNNKQTELDGIALHKSVRRGGEIAQLVTGVRIRHCHNISSTELFTASSKASSSHTMPI